MGNLKDPFAPLVRDTVADDFAGLEARPVASSPCSPLIGGLAMVGRLHGFDLLEQPIVSDLPQCPGQLIAARTTVDLRRHMIGSNVVILLDRGEAHRPIIMGVILEAAGGMAADKVQEKGTSVQVDDDRYVISAEREIVLRCGDSSITLTRAGKVIIKGNYVLSRSAGYNKIKGAAIDIN